MSYTCAKSNCPPWETSGAKVNYVVKHICILKIWLCLKQCRGSSKFRYTSVHTVCVNKNVNIYIRHYEKIVDPKCAKKNKLPLLIDISIWWTTISNKHTTRIWLSYFHSGVCFETFALLYCAKHTRLLSLAVAPPCTWIENRSFVDTVSPEKLTLFWLETPTDMCWPNTPSLSSYLVAEATLECATCWHHRVTEVKGPIKTKLSE